jgi:hypothetical protein
MNSWVDKKVIALKSLSVTVTKASRHVWYQQSNGRTNEAKQQEEQNVPFEIRMLETLTL